MLFPGQAPAILLSLEIFSKPKPKQAKTKAKESKDKATINGNAAIKATAEALKLRWTACSVLNNVMI